MATDLRKWHKTSLDQVGRIQSVEQNTTAAQLVANATNNSGRTAAIHLHCGNHSTGWMLYLAVVNGEIEHAFARENDSVKADSLRIVYLKAVPVSGSLRLTCPECGKRHTRDMARLLQDAVTSLATPKTRNNKKFVILT